ncbi:ATP-binding protein [Bradyrhizobium symbiodeficiens]|jgi:PAS domain S-box-containing protein|uniref:PAS domain-containing sensor histidine kinase n=1 Tax=Bradyrhizobium symbiodeficiens TaxID=1404367 RepID=UPI0030D529B1
MTERFRRHLLLISAGLLAALVFWIDSIAEYNSAISILYLAVLVLVSAAGSGNVVVRAAQVCVVLTILAWAVVHLHQPSVASALRCLSACMAISVTAALLLSRKRLEATKQDLGSSRSEVELFANSVPFVLWRSNPRGEIEYLNESWTTVTGLDRWTVLEGQRYNEVVHPDDMAVLVETVTTAVANRTMTDLKVRVRQADGSYRWMQIYDRPALSPLTGQVERYGGLSDVHDEVVAKEELQQLRKELEASNERLEQRVNERTTELMRTERRYSGLFDVSNMTFAEMDFSAAEAILDQIKSRGVTDLRSYMTAHPEEFARALSAIQTTRVNDALARMMGYESVSELVASPTAQFAEDGPEVLLRQLEMYFYGVDHIDGRTVLAGKDGRRIPVYSTATRLPDGLHLSSYVNLSDQERIEEMRQAAQAELARANRVATVGAFSASIAHELNQPITSMLMDAQTGLRLVARGSPEIETLTRILQRVAKTAQRVAAIVQRTRDNIVAGRRAVKAIDIRRLASDTRDLLDQDLKRADVELEILCEEAVPMIKGDPVELQQVFVNLVNNATDAMRDQPDTRRITLAIAAEEVAVRVRVTDTGPGIPDEHIEKLFEPFFTTKATGIGMGLQICRSAVEAMGGQLTVTNLASGGACFSFDLPLALKEPA